MILQLVAVFDRASGVYDGPIPVKQLAQAIRQFKDMARNEQSPIAKHPEDYTLMHVGTWNDSEGVVESKIPVKLMNGGEALAESTPAPKLESVDA